MFSEHIDIFVLNTATLNKDTKLRAIYIQINALTGQRISKLLNSKLVYFFHATFHIASSKQIPS